MASTYTTNLGIEKPATGEQSGTWGATTNTNFDILDQAIGGIEAVTLSTAGSSVSPTALPITDGAVSTGRNKYIEFVDGGDLGATAYVQLTPNDSEKVVYFRNSLSGSRSILIFQGTYSSSRDIEIPNGKDVVLKFDGGGSTAIVTYLQANEYYVGNTQLVGNLDVDNININGNTISSTDTNGNINLAPDGTGVVALSSTDLTFGDSDKAIFGAGSDLQIYHNGSDSYITDVGTGSLHIRGQSLILEDSVGNDFITMIDQGTGGTVSIKHFGSTKLATTATGVNVTGTVTADGLTVDGGGTNFPITVTSTDQYAGITFVDDTTTNSAVVAIYADGDELGLEAGNAERFRIDSSGNVGIGITSPTALLDVYKASQGGNSTFRAYGPAGQILWANGGASTSYLDSDTIVFRKSADGGNTESMRIDSSGNVKIGDATTDVTSKLTVSGNGSVNTGTFMYDGSAGTYFDINTNAANGTVNLEANARSGAFPPLTFTTGGSEAMRIDSSGNVGIGSSSSLTNRVRILSNSPTNYTDAQLELQSGVGDVFQSFHAGGATAVLWKHPRGVNVLEARDSSDSSYININAAAFVVSSDYRLKENVTYDWDATTRLKQLKPARFNFKPFEETGEKHHSDIVDGFLAHEVQDIVPEAVSGTKDAMRDEEYVVTPAVLDEDGNEITPAVIDIRSIPAYQGIDQSKLTPLLTKALIEAVEKIEQLEARIAALEAN